jgi:hypothetical protein
VGLSQEYHVLLLTALGGDMGSSGVGVEEVPSKDSSVLFS